MVQVVPLATAVPTLTASAKSWMVALASDVPLKVGVVSDV